MKVAIVTWITYNNYGTMLQAYALQNEVEKICKECRIVSDKPIIDAKRKKVDQKILTQKNGHEKGIKHIKGLFRRYILHPSAIPSRIHAVIRTRILKKREKAYIESQNKIIQFKDEELKIQDIDDINDYPALNDRYDVFICGSDQIWSMLPQNYNPYYFLEFAKKKKVSFATSIGSYRIEDKDKNVLKELLSNFSNVSLREKLTADQFKKLLHREVSWVVDPTLLHDKEFWKKFGKQTNLKQRDLLCYFLENKKWYFEFARKFANKYKLKMLLIPSRQEFANYKEIYMNPVGPKEFVGLFNEASFVLTDSYHGSIFSLIFNKQFLYLKRFADSEKYNQNIRVDSLLSELGLYKNVVVDENSFSLNNSTKIDYDSVEEKIEKLRRSSIQYLEKALEN